MKFCVNQWLNCLVGLVGYSEISVFSVVNNYVKKKTGRLTKRIFWVWWDKKGGLGQPAEVLFSFQTAILYATLYYNEKNEFCQAKKSYFKYFF